MKTIKKVISIIPFIIMMLFSLTACVDKEVKLESLSVKDGAPTEMLAGEIDYDSFTLVLTYSDKTTKEVTATRDMVDNNSYIACYNNVGEQTITFHYEDLSVDYKISVKKFEFGDVSLVDATYTYTGNKYSLKISGEIPSDACLIYPKGKEFTDAGEHEVVLRLVSGLYITKEIRGTLTILEAELDCDIKFQDKEFTYDGTAKSIEATGFEKYKDQIKVTYMIGQAETNSMIYAGTYTVKAVFDTGLNYKDIPDMTATLKIKKADYLINSTLYPFQAMEAEFDEKIDVHIKNEDSLPDGVKVTYSGYTTYKAGTYTVTASFIGDELNYNPIEPITTTLVRIKRKAPDLTKLKNPVTLDTKSVVYGTVVNGSIYQSLTLSQQAITNIPEAYELDPDGYEYYLDGVKIENANLLGGVKDAGEYTVYAHFKVKEAYKDNFEEPEPISGKLVITKRTIVITRTLEEYNTAIGLQADLTKTDYKDSLIIYIPQYKEYDYTGSIPVFTVEGLPQGMYIELSSSISKNPNVYEDIFCHVKYTYETIPGTELPLRDNDNNIVLNKDGKAAKNNYVLEEPSEGYQLTIQINKIHINTNFTDLTYSWDEANLAKNNINRDYIYDPSKTNGWPEWLEAHFYNYDDTPYTSNPTVPKSYTIKVKFTVSNEQLYLANKDFYDLDIDQNGNITTVSYGIINVLSKLYVPEFIDTSKVYSGEAEFVRMNASQFNSIVLPSGNPFGFTATFEYENGSLYKGNTSQGIHHVICKMELNAETSTYYRIPTKDEPNSNGKYDDIRFENGKYIIDIYQTIYNSGNKEVFVVDYVDSEYTYDGLAKELINTNPNRKGITYRITDGIKTVPNVNSITGEVGAYTIYVYFKFTDNSYGKALKDYYQVNATLNANGEYFVTRKLTINKDKHDVNYNVGPYEYNKVPDKIVSVSTSETWSEGIDFSYTTSSYKFFNGTEWIDITEDDVNIPGQYKVTVDTTISNTTYKNLYKTDTREIEFTVKKQKLNISAANCTFDYDGLPHRAELVGLPDVDGFVTDYNNNQTEPGTYTVTFKFTNNNPYYEDEDDRDVVLTIKTINIEVQTLIQYLSVSNRTVKQFTSINELLEGKLASGTVDTTFSFNNFDIKNLEMHYFDGNALYPASNTNRHYVSSLYTSDDCVFNNYTLSGEKVLVTFDLCLKKGRTCTDDIQGVFNNSDRKKTISLEIAVLKSQLLDVSFLKDSFYSETTINENDNLKGILFNTNNFVGKNVSYTYNIKYYDENNNLYDSTLYSECFANNTNIDYTFKVPTWGDRYALVEYELSCPDYGFNDGVDSYKVYKRTVKVHINPVNTLDITSLDNMFTYDEDDEVYKYSVDQYTEFVETITNSFDKENCDITWTITEKDQAKSRVRFGSNEPKTEYKFTKSTSCIGHLTVKAKNGLSFIIYVMEGGISVKKEVSEYTKDFEIEVNSKEAIDTDAIEAIFTPYPPTIYELSKAYCDDIQTRIANIGYSLDIVSIKIIDQGLNVYEGEDAKSLILPLNSDNSYFTLKVTFKSANSDYVFVDENNLTVDTYELTLKYDVTPREKVSFKEIEDAISEVNFSEVDEYTYFDEVYPSDEVYKLLAVTYPGLISVSVDITYGKIIEHSKNSFISQYLDVESTYGLNHINEAITTSIQIIKDSKDLESGFKTVFKIDFKFELLNEAKETHYFETNSIESKTLTMFIFVKGNIPLEDDANEFNTVKNGFVQTNPLEILQYSNISDCLNDYITSTHAIKSSTKVELIKNDDTAALINNQYFYVNGGDGHIMTDANTYDAVNDCYEDLYRVSITYNYGVDSLSGLQYGVIIDGTFKDTYTLVFYIKVKSVNVMCEQYKYGYDDPIYYGTPSELSFYMDDPVTKIISSMTNAYNLKDFKDKVNIDYSVYFSSNYNVSDPNVYLNNLNSGICYNIFKMNSLSREDAKSLSCVLRVKISVKSEYSNDYKFIDKNLNFKEGNYIVYNIPVEFISETVIDTTTVSDYWSKESDDNIMYYADSIWDYFLFGITGDAYYYSSCDVQVKDADFIITTTDESEYYYNSGNHSVQTVSRDKIRNNTVQVFDLDYRNDNIYPLLTKTTRSVKLNSLRLVTVDHKCFGFDSNGNPIYEKDITITAEKAREVYVPLDMGGTSVLKSYIGTNRDYTFKKGDKFLSDCFNLLEQQNMQYLKEDAYSYIPYPIMLYHEEIGEEYYGKNSYACNFNIATSSYILQHGNPTIPPYTPDFTSSDYKVTIHFEVKDELFANSDSTRYTLRMIYSGESEWSYKATKAWEGTFIVSIKD